jgi:glycosyltransferase involved in cell wall biosynthesis
MYSNVFYIPHFNVIGGIETYMYELAKKYSKYDITVVYSYGDQKQISRLSKYIRVIKNNGEKIKCKRLFIMYKSNLDLFEADYIIQITHADYKAQNLTPNKDPRINEHYAVSKSVAKSYEEISGLETKVCYNPLTLDKPRKVLKLISATRLTKEKGKDRMIKLANILTNNNIPFLWLIFTNDKQAIDNPNVIYMNPRLDIRDFIAGSDYLVQLSDTEAWSYSVLESLSLGTPVITTPIPCFEEMGIENGKNGYILPFNMKDIPINDIYENIPVFNFKAPKDIYDKLLIKEPSTYDPNKKVNATCIKGYTDLEHNKKYKKNDIINVSEKRYIYLKSLDLVK